MSLQLSCGLNMTHPGILVLFLNSRVSQVWLTFNSLVHRIKIPELCCHFQTWFLFKIGRIFIHVALNFFYFSQTAVLGGKKKWQKMVEISRFLPLSDKLPVSLLLNFVHSLTERFFRYYMFCSHVGLISYGLVCHKSTLAWAMAFCLIAPSHYQNHCWLIVEVLWHSHGNNFIASVTAAILCNEFENFIILKLLPHLPGPMSWYPAGGPGMKKWQKFAVSAHYLKKLLCVFFLIPLISCHLFDPSLE